MGTDPTSSKPKQVVVAGMRVDVTSYDDACARILEWAQLGERRSVCVANVHMVMEANDDPEFRAIIEAADLVTPDGVPLVWMMRRLGHPTQQRVYGPQLMLKLLTEAETHGVAVGFLGGAEETLALLQSRLRDEYPALNVAYVYSPPYRPLSPFEDTQTIDAIRNAGINILFVGLGCPKQERWMAQHRQDLPVVAVGVGAAFAFYAGTVRQAPSWMQRAGLEWVFRLLAEPARLWRRYLKHNPRFVAVAARQLWDARR